MPPLSSITRLVFQASCLSVGISMLWYALFGSGRYLHRQAGDVVLAIRAVGKRYPPFPIMLKTSPRDRPGIWFSGLCGSAWRNLSLTFAPWRSCRTRNFKDAEMEFFRGVVASRSARYLDERERRVRKPAPDSKVVGCDREPPERKHVSAGPPHTPGLLPCDLVHHWCTTSARARGAAGQNRRNHQLRKQPNPPAATLLRAPFPRCARVC